MKNKKIFIIKLFLIILAVIISGLYFMKQARSYLIGPEITVDFPRNGATLNEPFVTIRGKVSNVSVLLVDGRQVLADNAGNFEASLLLAEGYNIIGVSGKDKFGRETIKKLEIVLK